MIETTRLDAPLVVGAGVAGLTVALGLPRVYVVTVAEMGSTWWAQGGIAVALSPDDSPRQHADDTLSVSGGLGVEKVVDLLTGGGPGAVGNLIALGAEFDRDEKGELLLAREGGHQTRRVLHADGDATGAEVMRALIAAVEAAESVTMIQRRVIDLVMAGDRVAGVVTGQGKHREVLLAPAVVLATGGAGRLFSHTTNPSGVTGDGIAMAGRVGARLADLEFVQFHPTALHVGKDPMPCSPKPSGARGRSWSTPTAAASCLSITQWPSSLPETSWPGPSSGSMTVVSAAHISTPDRSSTSPIDSPP